MQLEGEFGAAGEAGEAAVDDEGGGVVFAGIVFGAPAGGGVGIGGVARGHGLFLEAGLDGFEFQLHGGVGVSLVERFGGDGEIGEVETAVGGEAGTALGEGFLGEGIEAEAGKVGLVGMGREREAVLLRGAGGDAGAAFDGRGLGAAAVDDEAVGGEIEEGVVGGGFKDVEVLPARVGNGRGVGGDGFGGRGRGDGRFLGREIEIDGVGEEGAGVGEGGKFVFLPGGKARGEFFGGEFADVGEEGFVSLGVGGEGGARAVGIGVEHFIALHGAGEGGGEGVVVFLREGIVFVIVAADAAHGQTKDAAAESGYDVIELIVANFLNGLGSSLTGEGTGDDETDGGGGIIGAGLKLVAGELKLKEAVVGKVGVEGADDPVAVMIGAGTEAIEFIAAALGVTNDVEPVARPPFSIGGGGEEPVDEEFEGFGGLVIDERGDCFGRGWQAGEIEAGAADEGFAAGGGTGGDAGGFLAGEDEVVDGIAGGGGIFNGRDGNGLERFERPPLAAGVEVDLVFGTGGARAGARVGGALGDPFLEVGNDGVGELLFRGHGEVFGDVAEGFDEEAVGGFAGDEGGAGFAAVEEAFAGIDVEAGLEFALLLGLGGVAGVALLREDGADFILEERKLLGGGFGGAEREGGEGGEGGEEREGGGGFHVVESG